MIFMIGRRGEASSFCLDLGEQIATDSAATHDLRQVEFVEAQHANLGELKFNNTVPVAPSLQVAH
jgi:hypothetical protein